MTSGPGWNPPDPPDPRLAVVPAPTGWCYECGVNFYHGPTRLCGQCRADDEAEDTDRAAEDRRLDNLRERGYE